eukprot:UN20330
MSSTGTHRIQIFNGDFCQNINIFKTYQSHICAFESHVRLRLFVIFERNFRFQMVQNSILQIYLSFFSQKMKKSLQNQNSKPSGNKHLFQKLQTISSAYAIRR